MLYLVPVLTISMLAYMAYATFFRLRRDRVVTQRELMRGRSTFRPKERARFLLRKSLPPVEQKAEWEEPLVASLAQADLESAGPSGAGGAEGPSAIPADAAPRLPAAPL
jgi:hypothetical protein